ncbi:hypothetical protein AB0858_01875, partial [Acinetobacter baumannii]
FYRSASLLKFAIEERISKKS